MICTDNIGIVILLHPYAKDAANASIDSDAASSAAGTKANTHSI
jgi:hypothetical protein